MNGLVLGRRVSKVPKQEVAALQPAARGQGRETGSQLRGKRWRVESRVLRLRCQCPDCDFTHGS